MKKHIIFILFAAVITQSILIKSMHIFERREEFKPEDLPSGSRPRQQSAATIAEEATAASTPKPGRHIRILTTTKPGPESSKVGVTIKQTSSETPDSPTTSESSTSISPASDLSRDEATTPDSRPRIHSTSLSEFIASPKSDPSSTQATMPDIHSTSLSEFVADSEPYITPTPRSFAAANKPTSYIHDIENGKSDDSFYLDLPPKRSLWSRIYSQRSPIPQSTATYKAAYELLSTDSEKKDYLYKILGLNKRADLDIIKKRYEAISKDKNLTSEQKIIANIAYHDICNLIAPIKFKKATLDPFSSDPFNF